MLAAALVPLLALTGGAVDMGRSYLAQSRLQAACDAGVLAARKKMASESGGTAGSISKDAAALGDKFFNVNFRNGAFGTLNRKFALTLESDSSLSAKASVDVPTTIMRIFGQAKVPVEVRCTAQIGMRNTDVMMVLDVTGSMMETNPSDSKPKLELLKDTVSSFHKQITANANSASRVRFGFVPYSTNVNTGNLLQDAWVATNWNYQTRKQVGTTGAVGTVSFWALGNPISGTANRTTSSTYPATLAGGVLSCLATPTGTKTFTWIENGTTQVDFPGPPTGKQTRTNYTYTYNGTEYAVVLNGSTCTVNKVVYSNWAVSFDWVTQPAYTTGSKWLYSQQNIDVSKWRTESIGCMEEPDTEEISAKDLIDGKVDLKRAIDLNIDAVPSGSSSSTRWRPMYPALVYGRQRLWDGSGNFDPSPVKTSDEYISPGQLGTANCPNPARKLAEMTASDVSNYLASLKVGGGTYHDTGMLWGARLLSANGLFASENADVSANQPTSRHIVMLTDGQTSTLDVNYTAYGFEPVDQRRWKPSSADSLTAIVEARFSFICQEAKKRNITIWFIAFGTELSPAMQACAGPGHAFYARNGNELTDAFAKISSQIADLRITK